MTALYALAGVALGLAGGAGYVAITRWRASLVANGGAALVVLTLPLALAPIAAAVVLASRVAPVAAWLTPLGILAARLVLVRPDAAGASPPARPSEDPRGREGPP